MQPVELDAYLARIGLSKRPGADLAGLRALQRAHRRAIPFENLDVRLGRAISLDADALFAKLVTQRRGGYCFEQNGLFVPALAALGFTARPLLARVWLFATEVPPRTHTFALVTLADGDWIADAGFGGGDTPPMPLAEGSEATAGGATYQLARDPGFGWMLTRNGDRQYSFTEERVWPADLALANHWTSSAPESRFRNAWIASIIAEEGLCSLNGPRLSHAGAETELDAAAYREALASRFGIALSDEEVAGLGLFPG